MVVGGTSGLGRAISLGLASAGADVIAASRRAEEVASVAAEIEAAGRRSLRVTADVRDRSSLEALHSAVLEQFERVDILFNCAGMTLRVPTLDCSEEDWSMILDTNLTGTLRSCQIFGRSMVEQRYGRIVNIASLATLVAFRDVAGIRREQGGSRRTDEIAGGGICSLRCDRKRYRARHLSHGAE